MYSEIELVARSDYSDRLVLVKNRKIAVYTSQSYTYDLVIKSIYFPVFPNIRDLHLRFWME